MKNLKFLFLSFCTLFFSFVYSDIGTGMNARETYVTDVIEMKDSIIITLDNNTIWELFQFSKRWRSISEWWNGVELKIDDEYLWIKNDFQKNDRIYVEYAVNVGKNFVDYLSGSDKNKFRSYHYTLKNLSASKIALAKPLTVAELVNSLLKYAEQRYDKGYSNGYSIGYLAGKSAGYNEGKSDGKTEGYMEGESEGYLDGHSEGYSEGHTYGHMEGYVEGHYEGSEDGFSQGHGEGYYQGRGDGFNDAASMYEGYEQG